MTHDNARGPWLVPALVALAAATAGLAAGWYLRGSNSMTSAVARPIEVQAAAGATREELEAAKREILAQLEILGSARPNNSPVSALASETVIELGQRIDALDARIALLDPNAKSRDHGELWAPPRGPGCRSIDAIIERLKAADEQRQAGGRSVDIESQLRQEHDLWTLDDFVRAYGPPRTWEHVKDGWHIMYGSFAVDGHDEKQSVFFWIQNGYLAQAGMDPSPP